MPGTGAVAGDIVACDAVTGAAAWAGAWAWAAVPGNTDTSITVNTGAYFASMNPSLHGKGMLT